MTTVEDAIAGGRRLAQHAVRTNRPVTACPYPADGGPLERAGRHAWIAEVLRLRPPTPGQVDFRSDLDALAAGEHASDTVDGVLLTAGADRPLVPPRR